jgi:RHS repeat-associated protein
MSPWSNLSARRFNRNRNRSRTLPYLETLEDRCLLTASNLLIQNEYQVLLRRLPSTDEISHWQAVLQSGETAAQLSAAFVASHEYATNLIQTQYVQLLNRTEEPQALGSWLGVVKGTVGLEILDQGVLASQEYFADHQSAVGGWLNAVYQDVLGRAPDAAGLTNWLDQAARGATRQLIAHDFLSSPEAHRVFVTTMYNQLLGRAPDGAGLNAWSAALDEGLSRSQITLMIAESPEFIARLSSGSIPSTTDGVSSLSAGPEELSFLDPTLNTVEGQTFSGIVGTFFDPTGTTSTASSYSARVTWGDGASSAGTVSGIGGAAGLQVSGSHLYAQAGSYDVRVSISSPAGQSLLINHTTAVVADAPLTGHAVSYGAQAGTYNDVVGYFSDTNHQALPKDFLATIDWADGTTSTGIVAGQTGTYTVSGRHSYKTGTYGVKVVVQDSGGSTSSWTSTLYVGTAPPAGSNPLLAADPTVSATEGASFSGSVATFTDSDGNTDPTRYSVTSITWGDGTPATGGSVSGSGPFTVTGTHTYSEEGSFAVQAVVHDTDGNNFTVTSTAQVADAALSVVSTNTPSATAGTSWSGQLVTFSDADSSGTSTDYSAVIAWGDGQSSAGTIGVSGANFTVSGTHTYHQGGPFTIQVTMQDGGGASTPASITTTVNGINPQGAILSFTAGSSSSATVATFSDTDGDHNTNDFSVTVNWGDGSVTTNPTLSAMYYNIRVQASHNYAQQGYYTITTSITDRVDGQTATVYSNANVTHATLYSSFTLPSPTYKLHVSGQVANFNDNDGDSTPSHFRAQINWGDGGTTAGTIGSGGVINGSYTYAQFGSYTITITLTDLADGSTSTSTGTLMVSNPGPLYFTAASSLSGTEGVALNSVTVGTLTDSDSNTNAAAYSGTLIDWGDGSSLASATVTGTGPFNIAGGHTYAEAGTYSITTYVFDSDNDSTVGVSSITINDAVLTPTGRTLSATTGLPLSAATLATFTDANTTSPVTDFTALVNWGDNTPVTAGPVTGSAGSYTVFGGHLYATANTYNVVVTIMDVDGQTVTANSTITVSNPSAALNVNAISATEGSSWTNTAAVFTPAAGTGGHTFVATLGWGDGAVTYGTVTSNGQGGFNITGTHTYADETSVNNPESVTVTVLDQTTGSVASRGTAAVTVADASLSPTANSITAWTNQTTGTIAVATFTDTNSPALATDFTASVSWGDASAASAGTVLPTPGGSQGQFTVYAQHTWTSANSFTVQTTITDVGTRTAQVSGIATVAASTTSITATEGSTFSGVVGTFSGSSALATGATITWGDGNQTSGTINSGTTSFTVSGTHTYADEGVDNLSVTVTFSVGNPQTDAGPAVVGDATLSGTPSSLTAWVGQPLGFVAGTSDTPTTIATFTDNSTSATVADFAGTTVNWGDGTTSTPTVVLAGPAGTFNLQANHTWVQPGSYTVTTTVLDKGGMATNLQGTATVGIREGQIYDAVFNLSLPDPVTTAPAASYNASIAWGDGTPNSTATATPVYSYSNGQLTGSLLVTAAHVYAGSGSFSVSATATNPNSGASSNGSKPLTVGDALLNAIPQTVNAVAGSSTGTITVAQFEDDNTSALTSQFTTITINWGDNTGNLTGTVASTATAGLFSVQGSHTYTAAPGTYTITATVTDPGGKSVVITSTASVNNAWTVLSGSGVRSAEPDRASLVPLGEAQVDLSQGAVRIAHPLDFDLSPGTSVGGNPSLTYDSATASPRPVLQLLLQSDPNTGNPAATQYQVQWSFNGVIQTTQTFPVTSFQAGAVYLMSVQVGSALTQTGVYPWSATITITKQGGGTTTATGSGYVPVVVRDSSPYGAGWGIDGIPQLYPISANGVVPAGLLWVSGQGDARFFTGSGPYTSPEDFGTLAQNGSNYLYTAQNQSQWNFNSSGLLTSVVFPTGQSLTYSYTGSLLTGVTAPDGGNTTLSYDTHSFLYQIAEPGSGRNVSLTQTEVQNGGVWQSTLTQITDVDNTTRTLGYDSAHHLTSDQYAPLYTSFTFDPGSALLTGVTRGQGSPNIPYTIVSAASTGLASTTTSLAWGKLTDGNSHTTQDLLDLRGRLLQETDALSNSTYEQLNGAGDLVREIDPLGHVTVNTYSPAEDLTQVTNADGSYTITQYDSKFHEVTQTTNSLGEQTSSVYDQTTGLQTSRTDSLANTTTFVWANGRMQSQTDPLAHISLYRYDSALRQSARIDSLGNWSQLTYDANGNEASSIDAQGYTTQFVANGRGLVTRTTDANGDVTQDQYYASGDLQSEVNARGFIQTSTIDSRGLTTSSTDNLGNATIDAYDPAGNLTSETDPNGNTSTNQYDADNRLTFATSPLGEQTQTQYDANGNVTATTDPYGLVSSNYFDLLNRPVLNVDPLGYSQITVLGPTGEALASINSIGATSRRVYDAKARPVVALDPLGNASLVQYDADGNLISTTDPRGYSTRYLYTGLNQQAAAIDPNGNIKRQVFNALGEVVQSIDGNGHSSTFAFDLLGRANSVSDADGHQWVKVFNVTGALLESIDANGNPILNTLDGDERTVKIKDPLGNVVTAQYDPVGNVLVFVDANGKPTRSQYNQDNQRIGTIDPNGNQIDSVFDKKGRELAQYDGNQNGSFTGYNADGQQTGSALATGASTTLAYNAMGKVVQETDADGNNTYTLYNQDGIVVAIIDPLGHRSATAYNQDNQPTQTVDRDGRTINNTYDAGGRLSNQVWIGANGSQADSLNFTFDHADNLTTAGNSYGSYTFTLDPADRPTRQVDPFSLTLNLTQDPNGNFTQITDSPGATETSIYNGDNQLTSRRLSGGPNNAQLRIDLTYTPDGQVSLLSRYSDTAANNLVGKTQVTWDPAGNLSELKHTNAATTVLEDFQYTRDAGNRLSSETDTINGMPTNTSYAYDVANQLTSAGGANYSFDLNGNRNMSGYQVGSANQVTSDGSWSYKYDPEGDVIEKDAVGGGVTWVYAYDNRNHLVSATESSGGSQQLQISLSYDVFGNLVEEDVTQSGSTTVTKFAQQIVGLAAGWLGLPRTWADLSASNQVQARRESLDGVSSLFARIGSDGTEAWYLSDHLGSTRGLMNNSGTLIDTLTFDAFGNIATESTPANGDRFKFAAGQWDSNLSQYHFGARWYDPADGRWTSPDPLGLGPDSNPYRYVFNDPTGRTDLTGLAASPVTGNAPAWAISLALKSGYGTWEQPLSQAALISTLRDNNIQVLASYFPTAAKKKDIWDKLYDLEKTLFENVGPFAAGFISGVTSGAAGFFADAADMIQNILTDPAGTIGNIVAGVQNLIGLVAQGKISDVMRMVLYRQFPLAMTLIEKWPNAGDFDRGYMAGQVVGQYGAQALTGALAAKIADIISSKIHGGKGPPKAPPGCDGNTSCFVAGTPVLVPPAGEEAFVAGQLSAVANPPQEITWWSRFGICIIAVSWALSEIVLARKRRGSADDEDADQEPADSCQQVPRMAVRSSNLTPFSREPSATAPSAGVLETARATNASRLALLSAARATRILHEGRRRRRSARGGRSFFSRLGGWACVAGLLFALSLWGLRNPNGSSSASPSLIDHVSSFKPIESLRVGVRVVTNDVHGTEPGPTAVDPRTWRLVKMRAWERWADGTWDDINIETLQPPEWLVVHKVRVGANVLIPLDLVEMGLPEDLQAEVLAVESCPPIKLAPGRVILTTVNHLNRYLFEVTVEDASGNQEKIRPTGFHKFFCATDAKWVSAQKLELGDQLQGQSSLLRVVGNIRVPRAHRVYNMTVEAEHVYRVSAVGVLAHNNCPSEIHAGRPGDWHAPNERIVPQVPPNATTPPGPGWEWRPKGSPVGGEGGGWFKPGPRETLHPDLGSIEHGPHWDWIDPRGHGWRIFPGGRIEPNPGRQ